MTRTAHTPTPFYADDNGSIRSCESDAIIANISDGGHINPNVILFDKAQQKKHAAFIVKACNAHDELVAAAKEAHSWLLEGNRSNRELEAEIVDQLRAILAKVQS